MRFNARTLGFLLVGSATCGAFAGAGTAALLVSALPQAPGIVQRIEQSSDDVLTETVERVLPSVVSIEISQVEDEELTGGGSGFFISEDGLVVTNRHVISDDARYTVITQDGERYPAKVLALDPSLDLGVLKIESSTTVPYLELGDSDALRPGQTVIAVGNALAEFQNSVTKGIVSGLNRRLYAGDFNEEELIEEAIQTDAAINPGNSGGPLLTLDGKVVGMNTAVSDGAQSLGFALPSNSLKRAVDSVRRFGRIVRPWIGVRYSLQEEGALVLRGGSGESAVEANSPAAKAGLKEGDLIIEIDGVAINIERSLGSAIGRREPGDIIIIKIIRDDKTMQIPVTLEERPKL